MSVPNTLDLYDNCSPGDCSSLSGMPYKGCLDSFSVYHIRKHSMALVPTLVMLMWLINTVDPLVNVVLSFII